MGTRGLTKVIYQGQVMVAQYGQWDHYLSGQGKTVQEFLKTLDKTEFLKNLMESNFVSESELKAMYNSWPIDRDESFYDIVAPEFSRDTGAEILTLIQDCPRLLYSSNGFSRDKLFCEGVFTLNFDNNTVKFNNKKWTFEQFKNLDLKLEQEKLES